MKRRWSKLRAAAQPDSERTIRIPAAVEIRAAAQPGAEGQPPGPPTFHAEPAYSGGILPGYAADLDLPVVVDLAGMTEARAMKANLDHKKDQRVGHLERVVNDKKTLVISGVLSAATSHRDTIVNSSQDKYPWEVSIEAVLRGLERIPKGRPVVVNGQSFTGPIYVSRRSVLTGLGFADAGADAGNSVTIAAAAARKGKTMEFDNWLEQNGFDPANISDKQRTTLQASYDATRRQVNEPPADPDGDDVLGLGSRRLAAKRVEEIRLIAHREFDRSPHDGERIETMCKAAIAEGWSASELELRLLRASREPARSRMTSRERTDVKVLEAALLQSAGYPNLESEYDEATLDGIDRNRLRGLGIQQILLMAACNNGYDGQPGEKIMPGNLSSILEYAFPPAHAQLRASGFSTADLSSVLTNVANKELASGHLETPQEWRQVSMVKSVNNFYAHTIAKMHGRTEFEDLTNAGELKHGSLSGESYTAQAKASGKIWTLGIEDVINDDVGAIDRLRTMVGRGAGERLNRRLWTLWLAGIAASFWSTAKGNKVEHANSTLLIDGVGLQMIITAFHAMRTPAADGRNIINGPPILLVVPPELEFVAERFYQSLNLVGGSSTVPASNIFANKYKPVIVPQLSDATYSGYSATHWWLHRSPSIAPAMVVAAIGGKVEPTVESVAPGPDRLGLSLRGYMFAEPSRGDDLCGVMSKGAA